MTSDLATRLSALLAQCRHPLFLLNHRRRFLFVNRAWEELTGIDQAQAQSLSCRLREASLGLSPDDSVRSLCFPPAEVLAGKSARTRRLRPEAPPGQRWWDIDFLPLCDAEGVICVLGRIVPVHEESPAPASAAADAAPARARKSRSAEKAPGKLERLAQLRERVFARYRLEEFHSNLPEVRRALEQGRLASQNRFPLFILGEAGSGKQWLARAIHSAGPRRDQVFVALDCEHLPLSSIAEVFYGEHILDGHIAVGTIYLREPAFLPREFQARLLEFVRETSLPADRDVPLPRMIAGSRLAPKEVIASGRFLDELYHAFATQVIELAPLRLRSSDLPELVARFLMRLQDDDGRSATLSAAALDCLRSYSWPENLRELLSVLASARRHATGSEIDVPDLPSSLRLSSGLGRPAADDRPLPLERLLEEAERRLILLALSRSGGNKTRAAEILSIFRPRLLRRMEALGIAAPTDITEET